MIYKFNYADLQNQNKTFSMANMQKVNLGEELNKSILQSKVLVGEEVKHLAENYDAIIYYELGVTWEDNENESGLRPDSIDVNLYQDGVLISTQTLSDSNSWSTNVEGLRAYIEGTETEITYTAEYPTLNGYDSAEYLSLRMNQNKDATTGETTSTLVSKGKSMTYTIQGKTALEKEIVVKKEWEDDSDSRQKRPESVTVNLYRDGAFVEAAELSAANEWLYRFKEMPIYKSVSETYEYTVEEVTKDEHYETTYEQNYDSNLFTGYDEITTETVNGLEIQFHADTETEADNDYFAIYYKMNGNTYLAGTWSGSEIGGLTVEIPVLDFYIFWRADGLSSNFYGFSINNIAHKEITVPSNPTTGSIPGLIATELSGKNYPETEHMPYSSNVTKLWHYNGKTVENKLITNEYRIIDSEVVVHHYLENTTTPVHDDVILTGYAWEEYTTEIPSDLATYYEFVSTTGDVTGEFATETKDVYYYYKLKDYNYKVKYYYAGVEDATLEEAYTATYGDLIGEYTAKIKDGYVLDKAEPLPLTITENEDTNILNVYYRKRDDLTYTVKYLEEGTNKVLKAEKFVENKTLDDVVTETAEEIDGYVKPEATEQTITIAAGTNEIIFYYTKRQDLTYTVKYLEQDTGKILASEKLVENQTFEDVVGENAIDIDGYTPVESEKTVEITTGTNEIIFYYTKRQDLTLTAYVYEEGTTNLITSQEYTDLEYLLEFTIELSDEDFPGYYIVGDKSKTATIGTGVNELVFYVTKRTDLVYTVKYVDSETREEIKEAKVVENQTYLAEIEENSVDIDGYVNPNATWTFQIGVEGNEYTFEYAKRTDLTYTVKYLEQDTNEILASEKQVTDQTFKSIATEQAIAISGYVLQSDYEQTVEITTGLNEIIFYYAKRTDLTYTVKYIDSETREILDSKTVENQRYLDVVSEEAIEIDGYVKPTQTTQTLEIKVGLNEITFYYTKRTDLVYTVKYIDSDTGVEIAETKVVENQTYNSTITETPIEISGYVKPSEAKTITIKTTGNEIEFAYEKRADLKVMVYYIEEATGQEIMLPVEMENRVYQEEVTVDALVLNGFYNIEPTQKTITVGVGENKIIFYYERRADLTYTVKYIDSATGNEISETKLKENQVYEDIITEKAIDIDGYIKPATEEQTIEITTSTNEIIFNYTKRTDLTYTVKYVDVDTQEEIKEAKVAENQIFDETIREYAPEIDGYNSPENIEESIKITTGENLIVFNYTKRTDLAYTVKYVDIDTQEEISKSKTVENQTFKSKATENAIEIDGYVKQAPLSQEIEITTGVNEIVFNYKKRNDLSIIVNYLEQGTETELSAPKVITDCTFNEKREVSAIDIDGYDKVGQTNVEVIVNTGENEVTFYYTKRTDLGYTVKYLEEGTEKELATSKVEENRTYLEEITETAIEIDGYNKVDPMAVSINIGTGLNEIVFYYTKRTDLSYTVKYLEEGTEKELATSKVEENRTYLEEITETAIDIDGYNKVDPIAASINIGTGLNEIVFYYTKRTDLSYTVKYLEEGTEKELATSKVEENKTYLEEITETAIEIDGYNKVDPIAASINIGTGLNEIVFYYTKRTDLSYTVKYLEKDTDKELNAAKELNNCTFEAEFEETAIDIDGYNIDGESSKTVEITTGTNEIIFYYTKRTDLSYTVKYLEEGTEKELATSKVEENRTYLEEITETAIEIDGYNKVDPIAASINIGTGLNEIVFYYTKRTDLSYTVKYIDRNTKEEIATEKVVQNRTYLEEITETAIDIDGYVNPEILTQSIVIGTDENTIVFEYKKKTDLYYTVKYLEVGSEVEVAPEKITENMTFNEEVTETAIEIDGYNKNGDTTKTINITTGLNEIIFYYTKRTDLGYTVKYLEEGTEKELATNKVEENRTYLEQITETAIEIEGFIKPDVEEQTIEMTTGTNEIIFYYTRRTDLGYTVKYLEEGTTREIVTSKVVENQVFEQEITEAAIEIDGFIKPETEEQTIEITTGTNEITFYYTRRTDLGYTVKYLEEGTEKELATSKVVENQAFEQEITEAAIEIDGFIKPETEEQTIEITTGTNEITFYYTRRTDLGYTVKYLEEGTEKELATSKVVENQAFEQEITEAAIEIDGFIKPGVEEQTIEITTGTNEITFYYTRRTDLGYTVKYLEEGTEKEIATSKVVENQTFEQEITEAAIEIDGFIKPETEEQTIEITTGTNEITFYYIRRTDLSYTVKYLETDTLKELAEEKVVENKAFKDIVVENAIDIPGYIKLEPTTEEIVIGTNTNEITFYYTKNTNIKYAIEYYYEGIKDDSKTENKVGTYLDVITDYEEKPITGYEETALYNYPLEISSDESKNIIEVHYEKQKFEYTVKYYYDGIEDNSKQEVYTAKFEEKITNYEEKPITGYVVDRISELVITEIPENNILNVYYEKGEFEYSVHYFYEGIEDISKVEKNKAIFGTIIDTYTEKNITGYKFVTTDYLPLTVTENAEDNVINVYYEKDSFEYTIEYYYDGIIDDSKTVKGTAKYEEEIKDYDYKEIPGYVESNLENYPLKVTEKSENNVIKIFYEKGKFEYTVHYFYEGVEDTSKVEKGIATYLDVIDNYEDKNITGYKFERVENKPLEISEKEEENIINVYYIKDEFEYTIHYFYEGVEDESKKEVLSAKFETEISTYPDKNIEDFILVREETLPLIISENSSKNVINIYYEKDSFEYTVNYYYDGIENEEAEEKLYYKLDEEVTEYPEKNIPGYKLEKVEGMPLTIARETEKNVIDVYYIKDNFEYTIEYYYDGILNDEKTEKNIAEYDSEITEYIDKNIEGYKLEKTENNPLTITEIVKDNVMKIYYVIDEENTKEISYTVEYYKDGILDEEATEVFSKRVQVLQPDYIEVDKTAINIEDKYEGYKLDAENTKEVPNFINNGEKIEIYYIRKDANVVVYYYERNSETELVDTIIIEGKVFDEYITEAKEVEGYTLIENTENTEGTMTENEIVVTYYYAKNVKANIKYVDIATGEVIEEETIDAKDGDTIEARAKDIENYVLVESPEETVIEMAKEDITLTFYYSHVSEGVIEKHIDQVTNEVIETRVYEGKEGDNYKTLAIEIEGYDLVTEITPENAEGTMTKEVIEVKYYYIRKAKVIVEYVDYITGEKLLEKDENGEKIDSTLIGEGHENDEYTTEPKEFEGYVLVETPENATGTMKVERTVDEEGNEAVEIETIVIYKYAKVASVKVEYLDIETNEKIAEDDIIQGYIGKEYSVEAKEISKYELVEEPKNKTGVMEIETITNEETGVTTENSVTTVTFKYMKKDGKVVVKYINKATGEILDETELTGKIDTEYETQEKEITGYTFLKEEYPENAEGIYTEETIEVTYYYVKIAKVKVQFLDKNSGEILYETEVYEGYEGEGYKTKPKEIPGYVLVIEEYPTNSDGTYEIETQEVTYYYARKMTLEISYIDVDTNEELLVKEIIEGKEGDIYKTEAKEIEYYKLHDSENAEGVLKAIVSKDEKTGKEVVDTNIEVVYKYRKAKFDIEVQKTIKEVLVNGVNRKVNNNKLSKVEIHRKEIENSNVKVIFQIKVTNTGEVPGSAIVSDMIPEGLTFDSSVNKAWTPKGEQAYVETSTLKPGESATYEMILTWNGKDEIGTFTNEIEVISTSNAVEYEETNMRNNKSEATVIIVTATGIEMMLSQIEIDTVKIIDVAILTIYAILLYKFVIKRKRD